MGNDVPSSQAASIRPPANAPGTDIPWSTIRLIVLTAAVVFVLLSAPFLFVIKHFIKFDSVDEYLGVSNEVGPKILAKIPEEIEAGYSKHFTLTTSPDADRTLVFESEPQQKVLVYINVEDFSDSTVQPIKLQVNGTCLVPEGFVKNRYDLSVYLAKCPPQGFLKLNTITIVLPGGPKKDGRVNVDLLVLVYEKIHDGSGIGPQEAKDLIK